MKERYKAVSRPLVIILVLLIVVVAATALYFTLPQPQTTSPQTSTTASTSSTALTTVPTSTSTTFTTTTTKPTTTSPSPTTTTTSTTTTTTTTTSPEEELQIYDVTSVKDVIQILKHIKFKYEFVNKTENEQHYFYFIMNDKGDEIVNGKEARVIEYTFDSDGEKHSFTVWILKENWRTVVKAIMDGKEVEEYMLPYIEYQSEWLWYPFVYISSYEYIWTGSTFVGNLELVATTQVSYGETTLKVNKYKFTPNPNFEPLKDLEKMEFDVAQLVENINLMTYYKLTFKDGSYHSYAVEELTRP